MIPCPEMMIGRSARVNRLRRPPDHPRVALRRGTIAAQVDLLRPDELRFLLEHVLGNVDVYRPGTARARDVERLAHRHRDVLGAHHEVVVLRDRLRDARDVRFLETVLAQQRARHVPRDRHHRRRVQVRGRDASDQVGRARTARRQADADLARGAGVAVGHVRGALFVPHQHVVDRGELGQRVVEREHHASGVPEDRRNSLPLETLQQDLGSRHPNHG